MARTHPPRKVVLKRAGYDRRMSAQGQPERGQEESMAEHHGGEYPRGDGGSGMGRGR